MSQDIILQFLRENYNDWYKAKDLNSRLNIGERALYFNLKALRKSGFIEVKEEGGTGRSKTNYEYRYKMVDKEILNILDEVESIHADLQDSSRSMVIELILIREIRRLKNEGVGREINNKTEGE